MTRSVGSAVDIFLLSTNLNFAAWEALLCLSPSLGSTRVQKRTEHAALQVEYELMARSWAALTGEHNEWYVDILCTDDESRIQRLVVAAHTHVLSLCLRVGEDAGASRGHFSSPQG